MSGAVFALLCGIFQNPLLKLLGADANTMGATVGYMKWTVVFGAVPAILNVVLAYMVRAEGSALHASLGTMSGCFLNILLDPILSCPGDLIWGQKAQGLQPFYPTVLPACIFFCFYSKREEIPLCV